MKGKSEIMFLHPAVAWDYSNVCHGKRIVTNKEVL
jgi:hypothetical protein